LKQVLRWLCRHEVFVMPARASLFWLPLFLAWFHLDEPYEIRVNSDLPLLKFCCDIFT
jgi:hypothetical protein